MDCAAKMEDDRNLSIEVYRKPTHTDQYLRFDSHHPLEHKLWVIKTLQHRAKAIPTTTQGTMKEQEHLKTELRTCNYPGVSEKFMRILQKQDIPGAVKTLQYPQTETGPPQGKTTQTNKQSNVVYANNPANDIANDSQVTIRIISMLRAFRLLDSMYGNRRQNPVTDRHKLRTVYLRMCAALGSRTVTVRMWAPYECRGYLSAKGPAAWPSVVVWPLVLIYRGCQLVLVAGLLFDVACLLLMW